MVITETNNNKTSIHMYKCLFEHINGHKASKRKSFIFALISRIDNKGAAHPLPTKSLNHILTVQLHLFQTVPIWSSLLLTRIFLCEMLVELMVMARGYSFMLQPTTWLFQAQCIGECMRIQTLQVLGNCI